MATKEDIFRKGLKAKKEEELAEHKTQIESCWESIQFLYVDDQFHPEKIDVNKMRILCSNMIAAIEAYQETKAEIAEL